MKHLGPVVTISRFKRLSEVVERANTGPYCLAAIELVAQAVQNCG